MVDNFKHIFKMENSKWPLNAELKNNLFALTLLSKFFNIPNCLPNANLIRVLNYRCLLKATNDFNANFNFIISK